MLEMKCPNAGIDGIIGGEAYEKGQNPDSGNQYFGSYR